tara:strand:- start:14235 stop:15023 length:789 start_codon:yes stop_codon:yes gene_type:complete
VKLNFFKRKKKQVGLFLSGGAVRGIAHIGVLRAFEEFNYPVDRIYGTSSGAIIGSLYCSGITSNELYKIVQNVSIRDFIKFKLSRQAFFSSEAIQIFIEKHIGKITFKDLKIPLGVFTTNIQTAKSELIMDPDYDVATAVRASSSIPGIFTPTVMNNNTYIDGALSYDHEQSRLYDCDVKIACNAISQKELVRTPNSIHEIMDRAVECMMISKAKFQSDDYHLQLDVIDQSMLSIDFKNRESLVEYGFKCIENNRKQIEAIL